MLPLKDDLPSRAAPVMTVSIVTMNVLVFLYQLTQGNIEGFFQTWSVIPVEYSRSTDIAPTHPGPFWITTLTSMFMHGGWMHLLGNMLFLWIFGDNLENLMGHLRYAIFYIVCGFAAAAAQILMGPDSLIPMLGASGAISGVLGGYVLLFPQKQVRAVIFNFLTTVPAFVAIGIWIVYQLVLGYLTPEGSGGVAYAAHIGGFIAGIALVKLFTLGRKV